MTDTAGSTLTDPPASVIIHDPLPESKWLWRRVFVFGLASASALGIFLMVQSIRDLSHHNPDLAVVAMIKITGWLLLLNWCNMTYYLIAPSAEQVTRWVQTAGMLKSGVQLATSAMVSSPSATAATTAVAGPAAPPPDLPPPPPPPAAPDEPDVDAAPTAR